MIVRKVLIYGISHPWRVRANSRQAAEIRTEVEDRFFEQLPDPRENQYSGSQQESLENLVRDLLNEALDDTEKSVFTLHYGEGLQLDAITRALSLTNSSGSKAYIVSAKRKLAKVVQRWNAKNKSSAGQRSGV